MIIILFRPITILLTAHFVPVFRQMTIIILCGRLTNIWWVCVGEYKDRLIDFSVQTTVTPRH